MWQASIALNFSINKLWIALHLVDIYQELSIPLNGMLLADFTSEHRLFSKSNYIKSMQIIWLLCFINMTTSFRQIPAHKVHSYRWVPCFVFTIWSDSFRRTRRHQVHSNLWVPCLVLTSWPAPFRKTRRLGCHGSGINSGKSTVVVWKNLSKGPPMGKFFQTTTVDFLQFIPELSIDAKKSQ